MFGTATILLKIFASFDQNILYENANKRFCGLFDLLFGITLNLHYCCAVREGRLRFGIANKIDFLFGTTLNLHYLCGLNQTITEQ